MQDVSHGQERTRIWPRPRGRPKAEITREQNDAFREANESCKYWDPRNIIEVDRWRKGTPILIRDVQISMMYNRFFLITLPDGTKVYSMPARDDVSDSLDAICPLPGAILVRTAEGWRYIVAPTEAGLALLSSGDGALTWGTAGAVNAWGDLVGDIADQVDLADALNSKQPVGDYSRKSANLADLDSLADARDNLDIYTREEVDAAISSIATGGSFEAFRATSNTDITYNPTPADWFSLIDCTIPAHDTDAQYLIAGIATWPSSYHGLRGGLLLNGSAIWPVGSHAGINSVGGGDGASFLTWSGVVITIPASTTSNTLSLGAQAQGSTSAMTIQHRSITALRIA